MELAKPKFYQRGWFKRLLGGLLILIVALIGLGVYFKAQLSAPRIGAEEPISVVIKSGQNINQIATQLQNQGIIKNALIFRIYGKITRQDGRLQAGTYSLSASLDIKAVYQALTSGKTKQFSIMIRPGAALNWRRNQGDENPSVAEIFEQAGYSKAEIKTALGKTYQTKLSQLLPEVTNLEGLLYADTFSFDLGAPLEQVVEHLLNHTAQAIKEHDLVNLYKKQGLTLYQGIVLASIIEQEVTSVDDRAQVAQVFLSRLRQDMNLGSDVTYQYACRMQGVANDLTIDSPYNTRRYQGLPPTPIAVPSLGSLLAVARPAEGDYLFFVSGDDNKNYFSRTYAEHERNAAEHCKIKCAAQ